MKSSNHNIYYTLLLILLGCNYYSQYLTWVNGSSLLSPLPVFGTQGVTNAANSPGGRGYSPSNFPGARWGSAAWTDSYGDLWLFGGIGYIQGSGSTVELNDLWKYKVNTNSFVWEKGTTSAWSSGSYGVQGIGTSFNFPSGREDLIQGLG